MTDPDRIVAGAVAGALLFISGSAQAALINRALSIVIDGSGSISSGEFNLQKNAYANVLGDGSVMPADGSVIINLVQFASGTRLELGALRIEDETDRATLVGAINAMGQLGGSTNIGGGITLGYTEMDALLASIPAVDFDIDFAKLIDVSTDGFHNTGTDPRTATQSANAAGYGFVNCLGIGAGADCSWNDGYGADFAANSFAELQPVLEAKVRSELGTVPAPATLALFALGLIGLRAQLGRRAC